jgi:hypothetical protein
MADFKNYNVGLHNVGSYQVSGWPWVTGGVIAAGAETQVSFPMVTKSVTVIASGTFATDVEQRISFVSRSSGHVYTGGHYITFDGPGDAITFNVKCKEIYVSSIGGATGFKVYAELTNIPIERVLVLTGSGHTALQT